MARILEALRLSNTQARLAPELPKIATDATLETAAADSSIGMSFIEVGGGPMEASADVLNARIERRAPQSRLHAEGKVHLVLHEPAQERSGVQFRPVGSATAARHNIAADLIAFHQPDHAVSHQYRSLLPQLLLADLPSQVLLFSGTGAGAQTTSVLLNVAIAAAQQGRQVIAIDTNFQRAEVAARLGLAVAPGLCEVSHGTVSLTRALQETAVPNLHALTAGEPANCRGWAMHSLGAIFNRLRKRFEVALVDGAAWTGAREQLALAGACDAVCLVASHDEASAAATDSLMTDLPRQRVKLRGCIIADETNASSCLDR